MLTSSISQTTNQVQTSEPSDKINSRIVAHGSSNFTETKDSGKSSMEPKPLPTDQKKEELKSHDELLKKNLAEADRLLSLGNSLYKAGRYKEALESYNQLLKLRSNDATVLNNRGIVLNELGRYEEALKSYNQLLELYPNDHSALHNRGITLRALGRSEEALKSCDQSLKLCPKDASILRNRGHALYDLRRYEEALESYSQSLELCPGDAHTLRNRGNALYELERYKEALENYSQSLKLRQNDADTVYNSGNAFYHLGQYEEALESYNQSLKLRPNHPETLSNRGGALYSLERYEEALESYNQSLKLRPNHANTLSNRGNVLYSLGRYEEALENYDQSLKLRPNHASTRKDRKWVLYALRQKLTLIAQCAQMQTVSSLVLSAFQVWVISPTPKKRNLMAEDLHPIWDMLKVNTSITHLDLSQNEDLTDEVIAPLVSLFLSGSFSRQSSNTPLQKIDLRKTKVTLSGIETLLDSIEKAKIEVQVFSDHQFMISPKYLDFNERDEKSRLGVGCLCTVYKAFYRGQAVALKKIKIEQMDRKLKEKFRGEFKNEISIMEKLEHPHVVKFYGYCISPYYGIVMELMAYPLDKILKNGKTLPVSMRYQIALDVLSGLDYLHRQGVLHRDVKSMNVLLNSQMRAKIADFGLSEIMPATQTSMDSVSIVGTMFWMAPEALKLKPQYSKKSDIYSYGVVLWELVTQKTPFTFMSQWMLEGCKKSHPNFSQLIAMCWREDPEQRPTTEEIAKYLIESEATERSGQSARVSISPPS